MNKMRETTVATFLTVMLFFIVISSVNAAPDPFKSLRVIPVGSTEGSEPIVTSTPANLIIYVNTEKHSPVMNVWLVIVLNKPTYDAINSLTADTATFDKGRFLLIPASESPKIPPTGFAPPFKDDPPDDPYAYDPSYPGCNKAERYETAEIRRRLGVEGEDIYYGYKFFYEPITTTPYEFTVTLNFDSPVSDVKALVLALGRTGTHSDPDPYEGPFDIKTPYGGSTLVVPELSPILLALSSFIAFGLYTIRRKK